MSTELMRSDSIEARLGSPSQIASAARQVASSLAFSKRHPLVTFVVLPIPMLAVLWVGYAAAIVGILSLFKPDAASPWAGSVVGVLVHGLAYVPAVALTLALGWIAARRHCRISWWLGSVALIAAVAGLLSVAFHMPTTPGTGQFAVGLGIPPALANWPQIMAPIFVAAMITLYMRASQRQQQLDAEHVA